MPSRILYKSNTYDPETQLPVYILDSFFLPSSLLISEQVKSDEELLNSLLTEIEEEFTLVILSSSFNKIQSAGDRLNLPLKLIKLLKSIPLVKIGLVQKIYIVHHNWLTKSLLDLLTVIRLTSNVNITHCDSLTSLSKHLDITQLNISLPTYIYDLNFNDKIVIPIHLEPIFKTPIIMANELTVANFKRLYRKLLSYLRNGDYGDLEMLLKSDLPTQTNDKVSILIECIKRKQILNLSDWSFVEVYKVFMEFLTSLNEINQPLVPVSLIIEGKAMKDVLKFEYHLGKLIYNNKYIIVKCFQLFQLIISKFKEEKEKLLYILELSKNLYNLRYSSNDPLSDDHSKIFSDFFEFMETALFDRTLFNFNELTPYKFDEFEWDKINSEIPQIALKKSDLTNLVNDVDEYLPASPLPRNLQKMTINEDNLLSTAPSSSSSSSSIIAAATASEEEEEDEEYDEAQKVKEYSFEEEKENMHLRPRYERLVKLTKPTIEEQKEIAKIEKEIKLKPWVKGKKVGLLAMFYEKEIINE